ncbi:MAG: hypothetical protein Q9223_003926 [Gallowayella weberi]
MDHLDTLEIQRRQNIQRNQDHLRKLGIYQKPETLRNEREKPAAKRRKLSPPQPSRASARIASATVAPVYNDDEAESQRVKQQKSASSTTRKKVKSSESIGTTTAIELPVDKVESLRQNWTTWSSSADAPYRDENSAFHFDSHPDFTPNKSPEEMLREGCFGGSYFRPLFSKRLGIIVSDDYKELPAAWLAGLDVDRYLVAPDYDPDVNKFKVSCGQSIEEWEAAGWINHTYDVRGWFQWYCRFFMGRRCDDDERQVGRWKRCVGETGRWRRMLIKKYASMGIREVFDDGEEEGQSDVSPVMHQTCFHWALEIRQDILDQYWKNAG